MKDLTMLVLAGGIGSRFAPFKTDKILFPFLDKPLAEYTFKRVIPKEVTKIVVVTNVLNDAYFKNLIIDKPVETVIQNEAKGMADAILLAKNNIQASEVIILIADDLFNPDLPQKIIDTARSTNAFAVIPGLEVQTYFPGGYLEVKDEMVTNIIEKPEVGHEPSNLITISGHYFQDSSVLIANLETTTSESDDVYEIALANIMKQHKCLLFRYNGFFASLKYSWNVLDISNLLLQEVDNFKGENLEIRENVVLEGNIYIGNNVKIFENTKIIGPTYIGDNTIIGNNNVIRNSIISSGCVTGFNSDIARSYLGKNCWLHSNYIGDSVLEENVSLGSGCVLANLRLDEKDIKANVKNLRTSTRRNKLGSLIAKNVRLGVNCSIMPGIKIGSESFIGAGLNLAQDVAEGKFVYQKTQLIIEDNIQQAASDRSMFKSKI